MRGVSRLDSPIAVPWASIVAVAASAVGLLVLRALDEFPTYLGAIFGEVGSEWWRYLAAPFVYDSVGYLFVIGCAVMIFGPAVERRLGTVATAFLMLACGALGMLAADGIEGALDSSEPLMASGGNGIALGLLCTWALLRRTEARYSGYGYDHVVHVTNGCDKAKVCTVTTSSNPEATNVTVEPTKTESVVMFRGSPAREFTATANCNAAP